jgi:hypothetical protein
MLTGKLFGKQQLVEREALPALVGGQQGVVDLGILDCAG